MKKQLSIVDEIAILIAQLFNRAIEAVVYVRDLILAYMNRLEFRAVY